MHYRKCINAISCTRHPFKLKRIQQGYGETRTMHIPFLLTALLYFLLPASLAYENATEDGAFLQHTPLKPLIASNLHSTTSGLNQRSVSIKGLLQIRQAQCDQTGFSVCPGSNTRCCPTGGECCTGTLRICYDSVVRY